jgi:hypothetical protein
VESPSNVVLSDGDLVSRVWLGCTADTHASNNTASIGRSGVDASSRVFRVVNPPGLDSCQLLLRSSQSLITHPAPITATRIAGPLSVPDMVSRSRVGSTLLDISTETMRLCRRTLDIREKAESYAFSQSGGVICKAAMDQERAPASAQSATRRTL